MYYVKARVPVGSKNAWGCESCLPLFADNSGNLQQDGHKNFQNWWKNDWEKNVSKTTLFVFVVEIDQLFSKVYFIYDLQLQNSISKVNNGFCYSMVVTKLAFHTT